MIELPEAFLVECNRTYIWYREEIGPLLARHGLDDAYNMRILEHPMYRWGPHEIINFLTKYPGT